MKKIITLITMLMMSLTGLNINSQTTQILLDKTEISSGIASLKPITNDEDKESCNKVNPVIIAEKNAAEEKAKKEEEERKAKEEAERKTKEEADKKEAEEKAKKQREAVEQRSKEETSKSDDKVSNKKENSETGSQGNKETNTQESSPAVPEINSGNTVSFNRIKNGIQVEDLDDSLINYAGEILNLIKNSSESEVVLNFDWTYDEYHTVIEAIENTYFRYAGVIHISYSSIDGDEYKLQITPTRENFNKNKELENFIANAVNSCVYKGMSERDAVIAINNYVCNMITYDINCGDAYTAFTTGRGRCASYAACVKAMCDYAGVECKEVQGKADGINGWESHAWNQVNIGGTWYYIDACWNDSTNNEYMFSSTLWDNHQI